MLTITFTSLLFILWLLRDERAILLSHRELPGPKNSLNVSTSFVKFSVCSNGLLRERGNSHGAWIAFISTHRCDQILLLRISPTAHTAFSSDESSFPMFLYSYSHTPLACHYPVHDIKSTSCLWCPAPFFAPPSSTMARNKDNQAKALLLYPNTTHSLHHHLPLPRPLHPSLLPMVAPRPKHPPMSSRHQLIQQKQAIILIRQAKPTSAAPQHTLHQIHHRRHLLRSGV